MHFNVFFQNMESVRFIENLLVMEYGERLQPSRDPIAIGRQVWRGSRFRGNDKL